MLITFLSDFHGAYTALRPTPGDVLVVCGDATRQGMFDELLEFLKWFGAQPFKHKVFVAGNHERGLAIDGITGNPGLRGLNTEYIRERFREKCEELGIHWLEDKGVTIDSVRFYGSPWVTACSGGYWAFELDRGSVEMRATRESIRKCDVLVTHMPPSGILDDVDGSHEGCAQLRARVDRLKPMVHAFGHFHDGAGREDRDGTTFVNASVMSGSYRVVRPEGVSVDIGTRLRDTSRPSIRLLGDE